MSTSIPYLTAGEFYDRVSPVRAVRALRDALRAGFDPAEDHQRISSRLSSGEFLLMPSEAGEIAGIKVLSVAPGNPARNLPRIQGTYILFDSETLTPRQLIDGVALTNVRTAAVSLAAIEDALLAGDGPLRVVLYGAGQQGMSHLLTLRAVLQGRREIESVTAVVRSAQNYAHLEDIEVVAAGSSRADEATAAAGLVLCTTTSREPLFDAQLVGPAAVVVAVGSHEPDARELPAALLGRSTVVVEDIATALRECGDVVMAIAEGELSAQDLVPMARAVRDPQLLRGNGPVVFKSSGMAWEDLVLAGAAVQAESE